MLVRSDPDSTLFHYRANLPPFPPLARRGRRQSVQLPALLRPLRIACQSLPLPRPGVTENDSSAKFRFALAWPREEGPVNCPLATSRCLLGTSRVGHLPTNAPVPGSTSSLLIPGNLFLQEPCHGGARCGDIPAVIAGSSLAVLARSVSSSFYRLRVPRLFCEALMPEPLANSLAEGNCCVRAPSFNQPKQF